MSTLAEVGTDRGEGHEVTLHGDLLTALVKHLLKDTWIEAGRIKQFRDQVSYIILDAVKREEKRALTRRWLLQMSPAAVLPHYLPSWCETGSSSSLLLNLGTPLLEEEPCSHLCRPKWKIRKVLRWYLPHSWLVRQNTNIINLILCIIWYYTVNMRTCNLSQSSLTGLKSNSSLLSTVKQSAYMLFSVLSVGSSQYSVVITLFDWQSRQGWYKWTHQDRLFFWTHKHVLPKKKEFGAVSS